MDNILIELIDFQLKNIPLEYKLSRNDIMRIRKKISTSMFNNDKCCVWEGYITHKNNKKRKPHIKFF